MKKFYFLTLALILGAMTMSAKTVYLNTGGSSLWNQAGAKFEAWAWGGSTADAWYDFTLVEGETDIYKTEMPDDRTGMKILRKDPNSASHSWDNNGKWNETGDISFVDGKNMYTITGWGTSDGVWQEYGAENEKIEFTVYLLKSSVSWTNVNIYAWNDGGNITASWPGTAMSTTMVEGDEYYYYTIENKSTVNVIFNNGTEQTVDLYNVTKDTYFELGGMDNGKYTANSSDIPTAIEEVGVDAGAAVYYNLQGVKVANPENGIFIKKQGNRTSKVVL